MSLNIKTVFENYLECALWASTDDEGDPLDETVCAGDVAQSAKDRMLADCQKFVDQNAAILEHSGLSAEQIGHDFWLTRNRHGSGFWDRGLGEIGKALSARAEAFGSCDLYVNDDGTIEAA